MKIDTSTTRAATVISNANSEGVGDRERGRVTRKLSYRKDDRAMRPMYGCPENFRESRSTPAAIFSEIFNGLSFRLSL